MRLKWEDAYDVKESTNARGEKVFDIYRKGTNSMVWANIEEMDLENVLKGLVNISEIAAQEELEDILGESK